MSEYSVSCNSIYHIDIIGETLEEKSIEQGDLKEYTKELIKETLLKNGYSVDMYRIGGSGQVPDPSEYDIVFLGTFTWGKGNIPDEVKDFVWEIHYKPDNIVVFGTGDTQFGGDDLFCYAAVQLARFYNSKVECLKIEQSPRGHQEEKVIKWTEGVIAKWKDLK